MPKRYFIAIEGVIGVGKTSLARLLQPSFEAETVLEIVEENPFLSSFYQDQAKYAFQTQIFFLLSRFRQMQVSAPDILTRSNVLSDYLLAKDCIFAELTLNRDELDMHRRLFPILASELPVPDLVVYLQASTDALMARIAQRDRPFERAMSRPYIDRLNLAYEEFFRGFADAPLLKLNVNQMDFVRNADDLREIADRIRAKLAVGQFQQQLL
ncbi:MAG: deoxynucleoside kinase [Chloroflexi bacterium]|nr:deoxynucleoside kinase [Chloroflexota bacterium]